MGHLVLFILLLSLVAVMMVMVVVAGFASFCFAFKICVFFEFCIYLGIYPLLNVQLARILSHSVGFLFTQLIVSLAVQA